MLCDTTREEFDRIRFYHCVGHNRDLAYMICANENCDKHPILCRNNETCTCLEYHKHHSSFQFCDVMRRIQEDLPLPKELADSYKTMSSALSQMTKIIDRCRWMHEQLITTYVESKFQYGSLRKKFINSEMPEFKEFNGESILRMLNELKKEKKMDNPYTVSPQRIADQTKKMLAQIKSFAGAVDGMYKVEDVKLTHIYRPSFESKVKSLIKEKNEQRQPPNQKKLGMWPQASITINGTRPAPQKQIREPESNPSEMPQRQKAPLEQRQPTQPIKVVAGRIKQTKEPIINQAPVPIPQNKSVIQNKKIDANDLTTISQHTTFVRIQNCKSSDWSSIGMKLLYAQKLVDLEVKDCQTGNVLCEYIGKMTNLNKLSIENCELTDIAIGELIQLPHLNELYLNRNIALTDVGFATLMHRMKNLNVLEMLLPNVTRFAIRGAEAGDIGAAHVAKNLPNLEVLDISQNKLTAKGAKAIAEKLLRLKELWITDNSIGDDGAMALAAIPSLRRLYISQNKVTKQAKKLIFERYRHLEL